MPKVKEEKYYQKSEVRSGFNTIDYSMRPEGVGMYGDFGRYTFQSALSDFKDVDIENLYHYAMQFIRDELGYKDELFTEYDSFRNHRNYDRHNTRKIERIGKKYQWIAMYNILARISDVHKVGRWNDEIFEFEGAWQTYVRDFDPTLNCNFLSPTNLPNYNSPNNKHDFFIDDETKDEAIIKEWASEPCDFFTLHPYKLIPEDTTGQKWVILTYFEKLENDIKNLNKGSFSFIHGSQELWSMSHGYIVKQEEFEIFKEELIEKNFMGRHFPEGFDIYKLFNREYAWAPGYRNIFDNYWLDYEVKIGEKITTKCKSSFPNFDKLFEDIDNNESATLLFEEKEYEFTEEVTKVLGQVMPAYSRLLWEEEYDASQEETTSFDLPCGDILNYLKLEQREYDGYFYSQDGILVAFDGALSKKYDGLLIRKDYLDKYLTENNYRLFWTCIGEKRYFLERDNQIMSEWSGFLYLDNNDVIGTTKYKKTYPQD